MTKSTAVPGSLVRHRLLWCVLAAALGTGACGPADVTDPAAVWDPCDLPADLIAEAGFPAGSQRRDVAAEPGWAGCGWSSGEAVVRVLFTTAGSPADVGGAGATHTEITVADRAGQRVQPAAADPAVTCTVVLPTEDGGLIRVRLDSAGPGTGGEVCGRAERVTSVLEPALPA
ncbi:MULTISPECIES: DUF3558 family protein [Nocardia]|uniref:DUF3558 family protein n=1 Tax=Nocardia TaxID=1817 RepID=UPI001895F274|nr:MULTISPECIES: DUF3558 family protein [Nocardia]MBF6348115.1 DUF3558 domain-containing protein [Nocardia flavorosea]